jgi:HK97 gp10 family phage protein
MADGVVIRTNMPDFLRQTRELGYDLERKVFRSGVAAATTVFRKAVLTVLDRPRRSAIRKGETPGTLRRAIYVKRARDSRLGLEHYFVGVRQGKKQRSRKGGNADAFYWKFVELGHLIRPRGGAIRGGRNSQRLQRERARASGAGRVPPYPFMKPAFEQGQKQALDKFEERVQQRIDKENAKR